MATGSNNAAWKEAFLTTCLDHKILKFGSFTLKSGRTSPYFFNTALFHRGDLVLALATAYAQALITYEPALDFTILFGVSWRPRGVTAFFGCTFADKHCPNLASL